MSELEGWSVVSRRKPKTVPTVLKSVEPMPSPCVVHPECAKNVHGLCVYAARAAIVCREWSRVGKCRWDKQCQFKHDADTN